MDLLGWAGISAIGEVRLIHDADAQRTREGTEEAQKDRFYKFFNV